MVAGQSAARRVIQARALQCSFSSVFHLRSAGMKEAAEAERLFLVAIGIPMAALGASGLWHSVKNNKW
jgi:hypothetical protein